MSLPFAYAGDPAIDQADSYEFNDDNSIPIEQAVDQQAQGWDNWNLGDPPPLTSEDLFGNHPLPGHVPPPITPVEGSPGITTHTPLTYHGTRIEGIVGSDTVTEDFIYRPTEEDIKKKRVDPGRWYRNYKRTVDPNHGPEGEDPFDEDWEEYLQQIEDAENADGSDPGISSDDPDVEEALDEMFGGGDEGSDESHNNPDVDENGFGEDLDDVSSQLQGLVALS